jgi:hypothetical protein
VKLLLQSTTFRSIASGIAGLIVYGGWAFFVNSEYGTQAGMKAALVQGSYSFVLTLCTTLIMEFLWQALQTVPRPVMATIVITNSFTFITAYSINWIFGTPAILLTILPGFTIGIAFTSVYVISLLKLVPVPKAENLEGGSKT